MSDSAWMLLFFGCFVSAEPDVLICSSSFSGAISFGRNTPGGLADPALALPPATTMRMVNRVHGNASDLGSAP